ENYAVTCLGMVRPGMDNIHYLNSESSLVIANSLQTESEGEDISAVDAEEPNFLESVFAAITNYWNGQALATGFEAE
ncbi:MAG: hypothetical protein Q4B50_03740, partial [Bacillota bacterium]|nr:hypothetical protein [Bacillota bacterium]